MNKIEDSAQDEIENSRAHNTKFYLYVIDNNETGGIGTYIFAPTPAELLACLREFIHNWVGVAGNTEVLSAVDKVLESNLPYSLLPDILLSQIDKITSKYCAVHLWSWGSIADLYSSNEPFCLEARTEFRDFCDNSEDETGKSDVKDSSRQISEEECGVFLNFLCEKVIR